MNISLLTLKKFQCHRILIFSNNLSQLDNCQILQDNKIIEPICEKNKVQTSQKIALVIDIFINTIKSI